MRGKIINLNKINKTLKVLAKHSINETVVNVSEYSSSNITVYNKSAINWALGEDLITMFKKENISWTIRFENSNMVINIW